MKAPALAMAVTAVLAGTPLAGGAFAQSSTSPANPNAGTPAVANPHANDPGARAGGANSFTEFSGQVGIPGRRILQRFRLTKDKEGSGEERLRKGRNSRGCTRLPATSSP